MRTIHYELLRPNEILAEKKRFSVAYIPYSPIEWHGVHNPIGVDGLNAQFLAWEAAKKIGGLVLPTLFMGTEGRLNEKQLASHGFSKDEYIVGIDFPKNTIPSMYFHDETLTLVLRDIVRMLDEQEYKLIVLVNAHGPAPHMRVLEAFEEECRHTLKNAKFLLAKYEMQVEIAGGHGTQLETSLMMHEYPGSVDLGELPAKPEILYGRDIGIADDEVYAGDPLPDFSVRRDPRDATAELGKRAVETIVENLCAQVLECYNML